MNLRSCVMAVLFSLAMASAHAQWHKAGKPVFDNDYRQQQSGFGVLLAVASNPEDFMREWYSTKESYVPHLQEVNHVKRGDTVGALVFFSGCAPEGETCDAVVDFKVLAPDGSIYGEHTGNLLWPQAVPKATVLALSQGNLFIRIEPKDPIGRYTVLVEIRSPSGKGNFRLKKYFIVDSE